MAKINNDIKIILTKYNNSVKYDDLGGELLIYAHRHPDNMVKSLFSYLEELFIFTGIGFEEVPKNVKFTVKNLYGEDLDYTVYAGFLYIRKNNNLDLSEPIGVVSFVPTTTHWAGTEFYAHFIEKVKEDV